VRGQVERAEQPALFGGKDDKKNGAFRSEAGSGFGVGRKGVRQLDHANRAGAVVVGAVPDFATAHAVMIVVAAHQNGLGFQFGIGAFQQSDYVIAGPGFHRSVAEVNGRARVGKRAGLRLQVAVDGGLQLGGRSSGARQDFLSGCV